VPQGRPLHQRFVVQSRKLFFDRKGKKDMIEKLKTKRGELYQDWMAIEPGPGGSNVRTVSDLHECYRKFRAIDELIEALEG